MSGFPLGAKIFHITHVENLASIVKNGALLADAAMLARGGPSATIGMSQIKARRLTLPVDGHPGCHVGDFVPFYFCPRSIMLFVLHCGNHPQLSYREGQAPIVHLESDLEEVLRWAATQGHRWAFSLANAGARYASFRSRREDLTELDWAAIAATDFREPAVKERKQAEFLMHHRFPWHLVSRIGVHSAHMQERCARVLEAAAHKPRLERRPDWYY